MIDFRNTNSVWASILAETLKRLGLTTAVICPGSRSAPLATAFAQTHGVDAIPVLDERSASFFALGVAQQSRRPVALVCTSGTAAANFYPAVIEARESRVPLLVLTADRPPELRDCHSGQTIDQLKLFGTYPNWQAELALPFLEMGTLSYLRQTVTHAWERSLHPVPGPVHLNIPFRDPLAPLPDATSVDLESQFQLEDFFSAISPHPFIQHYELRPFDKAQGPITNYDFSHPAVAAMRSRNYHRWPCPTPDATRILWCFGATFQNSKMASAGGGTFPSQKLCWPQSLFNFYLWFNFAQSPNGRTAGTRSSDSGGWTTD